LTDDQISLDYIQSFITLWEEFKHQLKPTGKKPGHWYQWGGIFRNLQKENYKTLTEPFKEKAKKIGLLAQKGKHPEKYAAVIHTKKGIISLPHRIFLFETHQPKNTLLEQLKNSPTPMMYEMIVDRIAGDLNIELKKSVLKLIKNIQTPNAKTLTGFPTEKQLKYSLRSRDIRTIQTGMEFLTQHSILRYINLIDTTRIGYKTHLIWHRTLLRDAAPRIKSQVLLSFPLNMDGKYISLLQYPQDFLSEISWFSPTKEVSLDFHIHGWHLKEIKGKRIDRWEASPPVISGISFYQTIPQIQAGVEFNLDPTFAPYSPSSDERKILLNITPQSNLDTAFLAKSQGFEIEVLKIALKNLYRKRILMKFPIFDNIGLAGLIHFSIHCSKGNPRPMMENIVNHIRYFPYFNLYGSLNKGIIVGSVNMPAEWVERFLYQLAELQQQEQEVKCTHYIGPEAYSTTKIKVEFS
jgi:hypothetical protein